MSEKSKKPLLRTHEAKEGAFYYCDHCKRRHSADLDKMVAHMAELKALHLHPVLVKQGRSNVLQVRA